MSEHVHNFNRWNVVSRTWGCLCGASAIGDDEAPMTPPSDPPPVSGESRLRELAASAAHDEHDYRRYGTPTTLPPNDKDGHSGEYDTCSHPDCVLVRQVATEASRSLGHFVCDGCGERLTVGPQMNVYHLKCDNQVEDVERYLTTTEASRAGWQPIATAPKDGTHILLWCVDEQEDGIEAVAAWFDGWVNPMTSKRLRYLDEPTHWMPLPSPPAVVPEEHKPMTPSPVDPYAPTQLDYAAAVAWLEDKRDDETLTDCIVRHIQRARQQALDQQAETPTSPVCIDGSHPSHSFEHSDTCSRCGKSPAVVTLEQSFALCDVHTPDKWEGDGTCVICEGQRLAETLKQVTGCDGNCSCVFSSRHEWHRAFCKERETLKQVTQERDEAQEAFKEMHDAACEWESKLTAAEAKVQARDETIRRLREALIKVLAHTAYIHPSDGRSLESLLVGLLNSVERIASHALAATPDTGEPT